MFRTTAGVIVLMVTIGNCVTAYGGVTEHAGAIAFISRRDGGIPHIYLETLAGATITQLTDGPYPENSLSWSPDGTRLAFWRGEDGEGIYTMNADGSGVRPLSPSPGFDMFPSWSPDGTQLVFTRVISPGSGPPDQITAIMTMTADGSAVQTVLNNNTFNMEPSWSPDGTKILFMSTLGGNGVQLYTMGADGSNVTALTMSLRASTAIRRGRLMAQK